MAEKYRETARVITQEAIGNGIYSMWLQTTDIGKAARPGQFISVYNKDRSRMLPRPISICETEPEGAVRIVYRVAGKGTEEFSRLGSGDTLELLGPLGNGFPLERMVEGKKAFLIGGGIGIPPMVELAKRLPGEKQIVVGYRDARLFLKEDLEKNGSVYVATENGSYGTAGNVLDCIRENNLEADVIYACGPTPMLRALKAYAQERGIECWLSLEEKMACGIGACLACVCQSKEVDDHSRVHNKRVCKEGPVFLSTEIEL